MKKQIIVEIAEDGSVQIETVGYRGASCEKATEAIEKALGVTGPRKRKPEFLQADTAREGQRS